MYVCKIIQKKIFLIDSLDFVCDVTSVAFSVSRDLEISHYKQGIEAL